MFSHKLVSLAAVSVLALGAAGCAQDDQPAAPGPVEPGPATMEPTTGPTTSGQTTAAPEQQSPEERNAAALRAIATAEQDQNGKAYEIDDEENDDTWEVDVMVGDRSVEVKVSGDGNNVISSGDDNDAEEEDRARLARAQTTLQQAIEAAVREAPGAVDDVELGEEDGRDAWEVTIDTTEIADVEVYVSPEDGSIIRVQR
jgi:uncharacterized membrane protein YkoI